MYFFFKRIFIHGNGLLGFFTLFMQIKHYFEMWQNADLYHKKKKKIQYNLEESDHDSDCECSCCNKSTTVAKKSKASNKGKAKKASNS
jgi:hypothetical protein